MCTIHLLASRTLLSHIFVVSLNHFQRVQIWLILEALLFLKCQALISLVKAAYFYFWR